MGAIKRSGSCLKRTIAAMQSFCGDEWKRRPETLHEGPLGTTNFRSIRESATPLKNSDCTVYSAAACFLLQLLNSGVPMWAMNVVEMTLLRRCKSEAASTHTGGARDIHVIICTK